MKARWIADGTRVENTEDRALSYEVWCACGFSSNEGSGVEHRATAKCGDRYGALLLEAARAANLENEFDAKCAREESAS